MADGKVKVVYKHIKNGAKGPEEDRLARENVGKQLEMVSTWKEDERTAIGGKGRRMQEAYPYPGGKAAAFRGNQNRRISPLIHC